LDFHYKTDLDTRELHGNGDNGDTAVIRGNGDGLNSESVDGLISSCMASCLTEQTAFSELLLDCING